MREMGAEMPGIRVRIRETGVVVLRIRVGMWGGGWNAENQGQNAKNLSKNVGMGAKKNMWRKKKERSGDG